MPKKHYFNTCPHCGAALDPGEVCDCESNRDVEKEEAKSMLNQNETEMKALLKNIDKNIMDALKMLMESMLADQKTKEAKRYHEFTISPAEVVEIIDADGGPTLLQLEFCEDALRYHRASHLNLTPDALALWSLAMLLEAGRIIGIRQERARLKAKTA